LGFIWDLGFGNWDFSIIMKTVKFYTLGCKVNQYDTQSIRERFLEKGFEEPQDSKPADIYVINTCTVTQKADANSLHFIRRARRENPKARIIVTGCLTELDEEKIKKEKGISLIVKNKDKERIFGLHGVSGFKSHTRAFLKIQDGCSNNCSYCKVPLVRGISRSKPIDEVIKEARRLVKNGFLEIVLTGICLGAYGKGLKEKPTLIDVIEELEKIEALLRIRLSSIEAGDISEGLINKIAQSQKLCPHLHIPIQSGDNQILKKMNRKFTFADYLHLIKRIRKRIPEVAITCDILVGFPGEREENFQNTLRLIKKVNPLKVHIFPYSLREGTKACNFKNTLNPGIVKERIYRLRNLSEDCSLIYKKQFLNRNMDVLIEAPVKQNKGYWQGYTDNYISVWVKSRRQLKNKLIPVKLKKIEKDIVLADLV